MTHSLDSYRQTKGEAPGMSSGWDEPYMGPLSPAQIQQINRMVPVVEAIDVYGSAALLYAGTTAVEHATQTEQASTHHAA